MFEKEGGERKSVNCQMEKAAQIHSCSYWKSVQFFVIKQCSWAYNSLPHPSHDNHKIYPCHFWQLVLESLDFRTGLDLQDCLPQYPQFKIGNRGQERLSDLPSIIELMRWQGAETQIVWSPDRNPEECQKSPRNSTDYIIRNEREDNWSRKVWKWMLTSCHISVHDLRYFQISFHCFKANKQW